MTNKSAKERQNPYLDALASFTHQDLSSKKPSFSDSTGSLIFLYRLRNGFLTFENELLVRPLDSSSVGVSAWNHPDGWKSEYGGLVSSLTFFAENIFGEQYGVTSNGEFAKFWPETGAIDTVASDIEGWAKWLYSDYQVETGYPFAVRFQNEHGPLRLGQRLAPIVPFSFGGSYEVSNLYASTDDAAMRTRASIAKQIENLPEGAPVTIRITE